MAYIGKTPITGNFVKLDAISVVNGQAGYTMNNGGSAFTDYENVNQFLVSLNGILQAPTDSFTVSGSTLTFASNLSTGDVIDFVIVLGNTLDIGTPSDATVTNAKTNFVSTSSSAGLQIKGDSTTAGTLQLNCEQNSHGVKLRSPAHSSGQSYTLTLPTGNVTADKFLKVASVSGSGTTGIGQLSFADVSSDCVKLATGTASAQSSISIDGYFTTDYNIYKLYVMGMNHSGTGQDAFMRVNQSGTAKTDSSYAHAWRYQGTSNSNSNNSGDINQWAGDSIGITNNQSSSASYPHHLEITVFDPLATDTEKMVSFHNIGNYNNNGGFLNQIGGGTYRGNTNAISGFTFFAGGSQTTTMDHWVLYGFKI
jgi:hypothetical protein